MTRPCARLGPPRYSPAPDRHLGTRHLLPRPHYGRRRRASLALAHAAAIAHAAAPAHASAIAHAAATDDADPLIRPEHGRRAALRRRADLLLMMIVALWGRHRSGCCSFVDSPQVQGEEERESCAGKSEKPREEKASGHRRCRTTWRTWDDGWGGGRGRRGGGVLCPVCREVFCWDRRLP